MKLAIIEPSRSGAEHLSINLSILKEVIRRQDIEFTLYCAQSHFRALNACVRHISLPVVSIVSRRFILKTFVELIALIFALMAARFHGYRQAVILSLFPTLLILLPLFSRLFGVSVVLILHGELDGLVNEEKQRITSYGYWVRKFFDSKGYRKICCIALGEGIHSRLSQIYPESASFVIWGNHPTPMPVSTSEFDRDIPIASVGVATEKKHAELFEMFASMFNCSNIKATHIGMTEPKLYYKYKSSINFSVAPSEYLSSQQFTNTLRKTLCAVFPYGSPSYQMTISGAMLDALSCGCQIVSLDNPFARDLQQEGFSISIVQNIGQLADFQELKNLNSFKMEPFERYSASAFVSRILEQLSDK